ncbi:MAG TPA: aldehyde ferredoxin oxidoreductase C-terminal domain-containing protein [Atribacteraceae bacterium]|nr:aldehyde ferredoxin oxidoreductase C-terminal domain-containing protein [Atribacteraceae bacterium]
MAGFRGKLLRVDLTRNVIKEERIPEQLLKRTLGGANLALYYLLRELPAGIDPLSGQNLLVFAVGPGTGCRAPGCDMHTVLAKSPLTGGIGESQATGSWGSRFKRAGFDLLLIGGKAETPRFLVIDQGKARLADASDLWGQDTTTVQARLLEKLGNDFSIAQTGVAGENGVLFASIVCDLCFINNRSGLGAVMGSKNLKAVAVRGYDEVPTADPGELQNLYSFFENHFLENPVNLLTSREGIASAVDSCNRDGLFSVANARTSFHPRAEGLEINQFLKRGTMHDVPCFACPARCKKTLGNGVLSTEPYGAPSMESIVDFGFSLELAYPDVVLELHRMSRRYGFDTTSWGVTLGFVAECFSRGSLTPADTGEMRIGFEEPYDVLPFTESMVYRKGFGDLAGRGVRFLTGELGADTYSFALQVKGKELPLHEPRIKQMLGLGYAVAPHGPDTFVVEHDTDFDEKAPTLFLDNILALGLVERLSSPLLNAKKVRMYHVLSQVFSFMDAACLCIFAFAPVRFFPFSRIPCLIQAITGWETSLYSLMKIGESRIILEKIFNLREGIGPEADWLPERMFQPIADGPGKGLSFDPTVFRQAISLYWAMAGCDAGSGWPKPEKIAELDLADFLP